MNREKEIEILMEDRCTEAEAIKLLNNGTIVYDDFEEHFEHYAKEWATDEDECSKFESMVKDGVPMADWSIVTHDGKKYYIAYVC